MKLGMFMMPLHPPHRPMHETYDEDLAKVVHADKVGFDEVWIGEHFTVITGPKSSPLSSLAERYGMTALPHDPQWLTLNCVSISQPSLSIMLQSP